jgi:hypothetical protein
VKAALNSFLFYGNFRSIKVFTVAIGLNINSNDLDYRAVSFSFTAKTLNFRWKDADLVAACESSLGFLFHGHFGSIKVFMVAIDLSIDSNVLDYHASTSVRSKSQRAKIFISQITNRKIN